MAVSNVLKDPASLYSPGERSPAWLKLKPGKKAGVREAQDLARLKLDVAVVANPAPYPVPL